MDTRRVYCSGPLFCAEEVGGMTAIARVLEEAGFETFLPHRDGLERYALKLASVPVPPVVSGIRSRIDYAIFSLDVYELVERCRAVVCNLNGRVPDEGMIVEAALAYAAGKPLVLFKDDIRAPFGGYDNSMLTSLARGKIVKRLKELPAAVEGEIARKGAAAPLSEDVKKAVSYGKRISAALEKLPDKLLNKQWSEEIVRQVIEESLPS